MADSWLGADGDSTSWSAAPVGPSEARALLQARLRLFVAIAALLSASYLGMVIVVYGLSGGARWAWLSQSWGPRVHLATVLVGAGVWLLCRLGTWSLRALLVLDTGFAFSQGLGYALTGFAFAQQGGQPNMQSMLAVAVVMLARAALVPVDARCTMYTTLGAVAPPVGAMAWMVSEGATAGSPMEMPLVDAVAWGVTILATAGMVSHATFRLRERVREVAQLGQYTLEEKIGAGGMGMVYRAHHALLRRPTAVKLLLPGATSPDDLRRFEREVQATAGLTHPNTVAIYDYGHSRDGVFYYAMEYIEGLTLGQVVEHDGPQGPERVIHVLRQVCGALGEAHSVGLVHRDIKPDNILLCERGGVPDVVKVVDFGLAKDLTDATSASTTDAVAGTPMYLSPEAIRRPGDVGPRSDLYALGAVGYFLLTGRHVFEGGSVVEVCSHHLATPPTPPSEVLGRALPVDLEDLILRCLAKDPARRFQSASELDDALAACASAARWDRRRAHAWWQRHRSGARRAAAPVPGASSVLALDLTPGARPEVVRTPTLRETA